MPCVYDEISLKYGMTKKGIFHPGVDLKVASQTLVKSCFDGVVRMAKYYGQYGKMVVVRHYNGLETVYSHLDKVCVKPGQIVNAGDVIGQAGKTGNTGSDLLHFETRFMNEYFDPELCIDFEEETLYKNTLVLMSSDFRITSLDEVGKSQPAPASGKPQPKPAAQTQVPVQTLPQKTVNQNVRPVQQTSTSTSQSVTSDTIQNPSPALDADSPEYHVVAQGETLYRISVNYHASVEKLMQLNHLKNGDIIKAGQKLRVK